MKCRISERLSVGGVSWGVCLCVLLCGGCLSTAWQEGGTDAELVPAEPDVEWPPALPLHRASSQVGGSLASTGYEDEGLEAITNSGWRVGGLWLTGARADDMEEKLGLQAPVLSAWGYQFQFQYGRAGSTVGLVNVIPLLLGLDESLPIPVVNVLVAMRYKSFEFAIGPHFSPMALLDPYWAEDDQVHVEGLGLAGLIGGWWRSGGVNLSVDLSFMLAGDLQAVGVTFGWNFAR